MQDFARLPAFDTGIAFCVAFLLGTAIGFERQWRQRKAGLRTTVLVTLGAAAFSRLGVELRGVEGATQIIAYIVSGIGFLGAGVILKDGGTIIGLNTAATLWCSAAVGACAGSGATAEALLLAGFVLAGNTILRPLVRWIDRRPIDQVSAEQEYRVHVLCAPEGSAEVRDLMDEVLTHADLPVREIETLMSGEEVLELAAVLIPTSVEAGELDAAVAKLEASPLVRTATWSSETT